MLFWWFFELYFFCFLGQARWRDRRSAARWIFKKMFWSTGQAGDILVGHWTTGMGEPELDPTMCESQFVIWSLVKKHKHTIDKCREHTHCCWVYALVALDHHQNEDWSKEDESLVSSST